MKNTHQEIQMRKNMSDAKTKNSIPLKERYSRSTKIIFWFFFSTDKSYFYLKRFCRKNFLMTSLMRNDQQYWFWAFFSSQFPDMIYHKVWSIMLEIYSDNCKVTLLFQGKKFHWGILKLGWRWTTVSCKNAQIQFLRSFLLSVSLRML